MPDRGAPSEFGGGVEKRHGVQPPPHVPTASERLSLMYRTGDESGLKDPDDGENFSGLLPLERQTQIREAEGVLKKGEEWDRMQAEGESEVEALRSPDV